MAKPQMAVKANARLGKFQMRNGRSASLFGTPKTAKGFWEGCLLPVNKQGKTETGYFWREDGSYFVAPVGVLHQYDLIEFVSEEVTMPNNE